jgi:CubicO group peptidase (beta-lactamase class C family)
MSDTPRDEILRIHQYFADPANAPQLLFASDKTSYLWQHMSSQFATDQLLRDGTIHQFPERLDPAIGRICVEFSNGKVKRVDDHFNTSTMDALLVLRDGNVVFERYKTMRRFDKHNWFSCSKIITGTLMALLEYEGKVDVMQPVSQYVPELAGSAWDTVTVEETLDMATGLDSTEHEEPDARTNPERGWFKWAVSIGLFAGTQQANPPPLDVLRAMRRTKPGHTVFEYNSINTYILQMIVENLSQQTIAEYFGERVWRRIGAQNDGYLLLDKQGHAMSFGFMNSTLRDLGRHGMIYTPSAGKFGQGPIIPEAVVRRFQTGLRPEMYSQGAFGAPFRDDFMVAGLANRYQWDIVCPDGDLFKAGAGGQGLYVSPSRDAVVAFFSTGDAKDERLGAWLARTVTQSFV